MAFLPDTNVWISLLKNPAGKLDAKVQSQPVTDILLCAVVKAELWHGAQKYGNRDAPGARFGDALCAVRLAPV
jgi:predicted nucleic acid-binding protein